jgi:hypothetical protein
VFTFNYEWIINEKRFFFQLPGCGKNAFCLLIFIDLWLNFAQPAQKNLSLCCNYIAIEPDKKFHVKNLPKMLGNFRPHFYPYQDNFFANYFHRFNKNKPKLSFSISRIQNHDKFFALPCELTSQIAAIAGDEVAAAARRAASRSNHRPDIHLALLVHAGYLLAQQNAQPSDGIHVNSFHQR